MQIYLVGGAVRDRLLGLPVRERDWVVVGGTPQALENLGFTGASAGAFPSTFTRKPEKNTRWPGPKPRQAPATVASKFARIPMSRWNKTCAAGI